MSGVDERQAQIDAWRSVASGWERHRDVVWESTRAVSERMVALVDPRAGEQLLEVAAGSGDTGLLAAERLRPGGRLVSTDAAPEMVEAARRRARELEVDDIDLVVGDAAALPFGDGSFDAALCRFGVMLVPDCDAAARELARVLRPGGRAAVAVWAESARNPWVSNVGRAALRLGHVDRPDPEAPGPFRLAEPGRLRTVLEGAGLTLESEEEVAVTWRAGSLDEWWTVMLDTSRLASQLVARLDQTDVARVRAAAEEQLAPFVGADGALSVPGVARVALARSADAS